MARSRSSSKRRPAPDPGAALGPEAGPTFGEVLAAEGMIEKVSRATRGIIAQSTDAAVERARVRLTVVSCMDCTAAKTCCSLVTSAYLYEAVPIAARLIAEGRDTPALRDVLKAAAHMMETTRTERYQRPCVFLDGDQRCTIYEDRPSVCGTHLVSSPPAACSDPSATVSKIVGPLQDTVPPQIEGEFCLQLGLRRIERPYRGALPRMVLLCLEAWSRRDYVTFLAERALPAAHRYAWATR
jgi:Fe-S-cluster containining protein